MGSIGDSREAIVSGTESRSGGEWRSPEARFVDAHPGLRHKMVESDAFSQIKRSAVLEIDGERLYIVKGDAQGDEEELFIEAVLNGAAGQGKLNRQLFAELEEDEKKLILHHFIK